MSEEKVGYKFARQLREVADLVETLDGNWYAPSFQIQINELDDFITVASRVEAGEVKGWSVSNDHRGLLVISRDVDYWFTREVTAEFTCMQKDTQREIDDLRSRLAVLEEGTAA